MDLSRDVIKLTGDIVTIPGVSALATLLVAIIDSVQACRSNKARLRLLAHSITEQLSNIDLQMKGKWDDAPSALRVVLDEFEIALQDVLKTVTSFNRKGKIKSFLTSTSRSLAITRMEDNLRSFNSKISVCLEMETALVGNDIQDLMAAQHETTVEIQSALLAIQNLVDPENRPSENSNEPSQQPAPAPSSPLGLEE
ncbi:hypothetical protein BU17DRAFT_97049 [Hysterangium stoloniferum]|nr:hypothetical protein BU17DRAFT_97049 [Hysterangium stoloniferum]